jgi:hypothetical protein
MGFYDAPYLYLFADRYLYQFDYQSMTLLRETRLNLFADDDQKQLVFDSANGTAWFLYSGSGLYKFSRADNYTSPQYISLPNRYDYIHLEADGQVWFYGNGLANYNGTAASTVPLARGSTSVIFNLESSVNKSLIYVPPDSTQAYEVCCHLLFFCFFAPN